MNRRVYAVILASGKGERMNCGFPKQFAEIKGKTIIERSIEAFEKNENALLEKMMKERGKSV